MVETNEAIFLTVGYNSDDSYFSYIFINLIVVDNNVIIFTRGRRTDAKLHTDTYPFVYIYIRLLLD